MKSITTPISPETAQAIRKFRIEDGLTTRQVIDLAVAALIASTTPAKPAETQEVGNSDLPAPPPAADSLTVDDGLADFESLLDTL
jgi:hypothetical protein